MTLVSEGVEGALANEQTPLVAHGSWLQVYLKKEVCEQLLHDLDQLLHTPNTDEELSSASALDRTQLAEEARALLSLTLPAQIEVADIQLKITVLPTTHNGLPTSTVH